MTELPPELSPRAPSTAKKPKARPPSTQGAQHGLTSAGVVVIVLAGSLVGLLIDRFTLDSGLIFGVAFVAASVYAALQVRPSHLLTAVIVPPLVFFVLALGEAIVDSATRAVSDLTLDVVSTLAISAPALWAGTLAAGVIVLVRWRRTS